MNAHLGRQGIKIGRGTMVDASLISASSSTKDRNKERDPEMHQTAKGKQWYFGMKADVGVDSTHELVHTVLASAANVADRDALPYWPAHRRRRRARQGVLDRDAAACHRGPVELDPKLGRPGSLIGLDVRRALHGSEDLLQRSRAPFQFLRIRPEELREHPA